MKEQLLEHFLGYPKIVYDLFTVKIDGDQIEHKAIGRHAKFYIPDGPNRYLAISSSKLDDKINASNASYKEILSMIEKELDELLLFAKRYGVLILDLPDAYYTAIAYRTDKNTTWEVLIPTNDSSENEHRIQEITSKLIHQKGFKAFYT